MDLLALGNNDLSNFLLNTLISIPGLLLFFSFRGFFQAWVAKKLGDYTPAQMGFLTMNPMAHIDLIGFICMILVGFGFGKSIQFDSRNYKHLKRDGAIQVLAAPVSGLIMGFGMSFLFYLLILIGSWQDLLLNKTYVVLYTIFYEAFRLSIYLTVFLFLPLPGFDSYRLIANFLPYKHYRKLYTIEKYSLFIFLGFIFLLQAPGIGEFLEIYLIHIPSGFIMHVLSAPWRFLLGLFA